MWNFNYVTSIVYKHDYVYRVVFDDGLEGDVDFAQYVGSGPVFDALRELALFRQARIDGDTTSWPNGADIAPETLYERIESANKAPQPRVQAGRKRRQEARRHPRGMISAVPAPRPTAAGNWNSACAWTRIDVVLVDNP